jgi:hypothetical protein
MSENFYDASPINSKRAHTIRAAKLYDASPIKIKKPHATKVEMAYRRRRLIGIVEEEHPATVRQVYYQADVHKIVGKSDSDYNKVQRMLTDLRRAETIPYEWIVDVGRFARQPYTVSGIIEALNDTRRDYRKSPWEFAEGYVQIWIEKNALIGVIEPVTEEYDVPLMSAVGYSSISFLHKAAQIMRGIACPIWIYQFGDLDPSGAHASDVIEKELRGFAPGADIHYERIAITPAQVAEFGLESALRPTKTTDPRYRWFRELYKDDPVTQGGQLSVELDAIRPNLLRDLVRGVIERHLPRPVLDHANMMGAQEKARLGRLMDEYIAAETARRSVYSPYGSEHLDALWGAP